MHPQEGQGLVPMPLALRRATIPASSMVGIIFFFEKVTEFLDRLTHDEVGYNIGGHVAAGIMGVVLIGITRSMKITEPMSEDMGGVVNGVNVFVGSFDIEPDFPFAIVCLSIGHITGVGFQAGPDDGRQGGSGLQTDGLEPVDDRSEALGFGHFAGVSFLVLTSRDSNTMNISGMEAGIV